MRGNSLCTGFEASVGWNRAAVLRSYNNKGKLSPSKHQTEQKNEELDDQPVTWKAENYQRETAKPEACSLRRIHRTDDPLRLTRRNGGKTE